MAKAKVSSLFSLGIPSVMIARGAIMNPSIFRPLQAPVDDMIVKYLKKVPARILLFTNVMKNDYSHILF